MFVRIKCFQMLETSTLPTHHIICKLYSSPLPTIMTTRKKAQQNEGQANFLLEMFFIFSTALATEDLKPTFNINEASTLELKRQTVNILQRKRTRFSPYIQCR